MLNHMSLKSYFIEALVPISCITIFPCLVLYAHYLLTSAPELATVCMTFILYLGIFLTVFWKAVLSIREREAICKLIANFKRNRI